MDHEIGAEGWTVEVIHTGLNKNQVQKDNSPSFLRECQLNQPTNPVFFNPHPKCGPANKNQINTKYKQIILS